MQESHSTKNPHQSRHCNISEALTEESSGVRDSSVDSAETQLMLEAVRANLVLSFTASLFVLAQNNLVSRPHYRNHALQIQKSCFTKNSGSLGHCQRYFITKRERRLSLLSMLCYSLGFHPILLFDCLLAPSCQGLFKNVFCSCHTLCSQPRAIESRPMGCWDGPLPSQTSSSVHHGGRVGSQRRYSGVRVLPAWLRLHSLER